MVASCRPREGEIGPRWFQSPSLRGSGRFRDETKNHRPGAPEFQSPSLRGSGRFFLALNFLAREWFCFNPLHCGAVVASPSHDSGPTLTGFVSIPFIAGQWSLLDAMVAGLERALRVSIPFIAGQWSLRHRVWVLFAIEGWFQSPSLRGSGRFWEALYCFGHVPTGFNPLHCGAVVASHGAERAGDSQPPGFNPLHCGAVVASSGRQASINCW